MDELLRYLQGFSPTLPVPKQTAIAEMIKNADEELWRRLSMGAGSQGEWRQSEVADAVRGLQSSDLEAAVAIGWAWSGQHAWEGDLVHQITNATDSSWCRTDRPKIGRRRLS